jgi:hypothetical protein
MRWAWLAGAALFGVAALSVYWAFQSPAFVSGLAALAAGAAWKAIYPAITKRLPPEEEASWRDAERAGRGDEWLRKRRGAPPKG